MQIEPISCESEDESAEIGVKSYTTQRRTQDQPKRTVDAANMVKTIVRYIFLIHHVVTPDPNHPYS